MVNSLTSSLLLKVVQAHQFLEKIWKYDLLTTSPSNGSYSLQSAANLASGSLLTVHLHILAINFQFCFEMSFKSIVFLFLLVATFYINYRAIISYLVSFPTI